MRDAKLISKPMMDADRTPACGVKGSSVEGTAPPTAVEDPRAAAMLPEQLLHEGEIIILLLKPSPWFILLECLPMLGWIGLFLTAGLVLASQGWYVIGRTDMVLAALTLAGLRLFWQFLEWLSRVYVLTDRRIVRVRGVVRVQVFECALSRVQHTQVIFNLRERLLGLGSIYIATAGTVGADVSWRMLSRPLEVHQIILKTLDRYR